VNAPRIPSGKEELCCTINRLLKGVHQVFREIQELERRPHSILGLEIREPAGPIFASNRTIHCDLETSINEGGKSCGKVLYEKPDVMHAFTMLVVEILPNRLAFQSF